MALQSLLDGKTKASEPVKEQSKATDKKEQAKSSGDDAKKDVVMVDDVPIALTPPTSPLRDDNKEVASDKPGIVRSDSELALELQRQWEQELRSTSKHPL
jgi:hypothetical protein